MPHRIGIRRPCLSARSQLTREIARHRPPERRSRYRAFPRYAYSQSQHDPISSVVTPPPAPTVQSTRHCRTRHRIRTRSHGTSMVTDLAAASDTEPRRTTSRPRQSAHRQTVARAVRRPRRAAFLAPAHRIPLYTTRGTLHANVMYPSAPEFLELLDTHEVDWIIDNHLFHGMPFYSSHRPNLHREMLSAISTGLKVRSRDICVIGSARIGYSLSPPKFGTPFRDASDIDVCVVSDSLFDPSWLDILRTQPKRTVPIDSRTKHHLIGCSSGTERFGGSGVG